MLSEYSLLDNCKKGCAGETGLFPILMYALGQVAFPLYVQVSLPVKGRDRRWCLISLPTSPGFPFSTSMSHFKTLDLSPHSNTLGRKEAAGVSSQRLTCLSHAMTASRSAGVASGPPELRLSTRRTGSRWCFLGNLGRGPGQWWRCGQPLHKGLRAENRRG